MEKVSNTDEYIAQFPEEIREKLENIRAVIQSTAPEAEEVISYGMPAYKVYKRILVYFAAFKNHIGFFPTVTGIVKFKDELSDYETSKGTIRFPNDKKIPFDLIKKIVKFRVAENLAKAKAQKSKRSKT